MIMILGKNILILVLKFYIGYLDHANYRNLKLHHGVVI